MSTLNSKYKTLNPKPLEILPTSYDDPPTVGKRAELKKKVIQANADLHEDVTKTLKTMIKQLTMAIIVKSQPHM